MDTTSFAQSLLSQYMTTLAARVGDCMLDGPSMYCDEYRNQWTTLGFKRTLALEESGDDALFALHECVHTLFWNLDAIIRAEGVKLTPSGTYDKMVWLKWRKRPHAFIEQTPAGFVFPDDLGSRYAVAACRLLIIIDGKVVAFKGKDEGKEFPEVGGPD